MLAQFNGKNNGQVSIIGDAPASYTGIMWVQIPHLAPNYLGT